MNGKLEEFLSESRIYPHRKGGCRVNKGIIHHSAIRADRSGISSGLRHKLPQAGESLRRHEKHP
jgi:hypothetical protein